MTPARGWLAVAGGVVLYLLLEAGLFRTGLYQAFLAPDSYAGNFEFVAEDYSRRLLDVQLMVARIGLADIPELLLSYPQWAEQREVLRKEFLKNPRQQWARVLGSCRGEDRTLAGLRIDWQTNKATYPESLSARERQLIDDVLLRPAEPQTGRMGAYRRECFGRILHRYQGSRTRLLFARVPRGPIPRPASLVQKRSAVPRQLPGVTLLDEGLLNELEHPDFFIDPLHLNAEGCRRLTEILTRAVRKQLLALASYAFYMAWNPQFLVLLLALTVVDYLAAL